MREDKEKISVWEKSTANKHITSFEFLGDGDKEGNNIFSLPYKMKHFHSS